MRRLENLNIQLQEVRHWDCLVPNQGETSNINSSLNNVLINNNPGNYVPQSVTVINNVSPGEIGSTLNGLMESTFQSNAVELRPSEREAVKQSCIILQESAKRNENSNEVLVELGEKLVDKVETGVEVAQTFSDIPVTQDIISQALDATAVILPQLGAGLIVIYCGGTLVVVFTKSIFQAIFNNPVMFNVVAERAGEIVINESTPIVHDAINRVMDTSISAAQEIVKQGFKDKFKEVCLLMLAKGQPFMINFLKHSIDTMTSLW